MPDLRIDGPEVMADSNLANLDPTHLDEMVTPALVRDVRSINIDLGAWKQEIEEKVTQAADFGPNLCTESDVSSRFGPRFGPK